jgi:hypothetical protein
MSVNPAISSFSIIDEYVLDAFKKAGLIPIEASIGFDSSWNAKAAHGRRILNRMVEGLAVEGFLDYFVARQILPVTIGTTQYDLLALDPDILNVVDTASYIPASNGAELIKTNGETPVKPLSRFAWNQLANKDVSARPSNYYLERNGSSTLTLFIWPAPVENANIRLWVHRIPADNSVGSDNVDLKRHWGDWIVHQMAAQLMDDAKLPLDERSMMQAKATAMLEKAKMYELSNEPVDMMHVHMSPWASRGYGH